MQLKVIKPSNKIHYIKIFPNWVTLITWKKNKWIFDEKNNASGYDAVRTSNPWWTNSRYSIFIVQTFCFDLLLFWPHGTTFLRNLLCIMREGGMRLSSLHPFKRRPCLSQVKESIIERLCYSFLNGVAAYFSIPYFKTINQQYLLQ